jgi:hypothetical protein
MLVAGDRYLEGVLAKLGRELVGLLGETDEFKDVGDH